MYKRSRTEPLSQKPEEQEEARREEEEEVEKNEALETSTLYPESSEDVIKDDGCDRKLRGICCNHSLLHQLSPQEVEQQRTGNWPGNRINRFIRE